MKTMTRFIASAAAALLAGTFAFGSAAEAQSYHGRHDRGDRHERYDRHDRGDRHDRYDRRDRNDRYDRRDHRRYDNGYRHDYRQGYRSGWRDRSDWRRGGYVSYHDWDRGRYVDYRYQRGLYRPPYGYEWRRVDNNYVLAAVATGLIASIIIGGY